MQGKCAKHNRTISCMENQTAKYSGWNGLMATSACTQEIPANSNIYITFNEL